MTHTPAICRCNHCSGEIEFESERAGESVICPHCEGETKLYIPWREPAAPPAPPPVQSRGVATADETVFYAAGQITVTNARFVAGSNVYPIAGITSVSFEKAPDKSGIPMALALFVGVCSLVLLGDGNYRLGGVLLIVTFALGAIAFSLRSRTFIVKIGTAGGDRNAFESSNEAEIYRIIGGINDAIIARG